MAMHPTHNEPTPPPTAYDKAAQIEDEITELYAHVNAATYRLLVLIRELDKEQPWGAWGLNSCAHWLNWKCGVGMVAAREKVRVASALEGLPQISERFRKGKVSYSKVRAMTRVATAENEDYLLEIAEYGTAAHVEELVRKYRGVEREEELRRVKKQYARRELTYYHEEDGSLVIRARLPAEEGALVLEALQAGADRMWREEREQRKPNEGLGTEDLADSGVAGVSAETIPEVPPRDLSTRAFYPLPPWGDSAESRLPEEYRGFGLVEISPEFVVEEDTPCTRRADALVRMAETWLCSGAKAARGGEKYQVVVHIDGETLRTGGPGTCELEQGPWLAVDTARRIACDASLVEITEDEHGDVLDIGRKSRTIPPSIARALRARDRGCQFPGCTHRHFVDGHHIKHWSAGGETRLDNLVQLCRTHHRLIHEGGFSVERTESKELLFKRPDGVVVEAAPRRQPNTCHSITSIRIRNDSEGLDITPDTGVTKWDGVPLDYHMAVDELLVRRERSDVRISSRVS